MDTSAPVTLGSNLLRPRRSLARRWVVIVSLIVHAVAIGAYVVVGMLRIERLKPDRGRISVAVGMELPDTGGGPEPGSKPKDVVKKKDKPKIEVDVPVQPTKDTSKISNEGQPATTTSTTTGTGPSTGPTTGDTPTKTGGECTGEDCKKPETTKVEPVVKKTKTPTPMAPPDFKRLRKTSDADAAIQPSDNDKTAILRSGNTVVRGSVWVCIDETGRVSSTKLTGSTGYSDYDDRLVRGTRTWEYRPAIQDGVAVPTCSNVNFTFRIAK